MRCAERRHQNVRTLVLGGVLLLTLSGCRIRHTPQERAAPGASPAAPSLSVTAKDPKKPKGLQKPPTQGPSPAPPVQEATRDDAPVGDGAEVPAEVLPAADTERALVPEGWKVFAYAGGIDFPKPLESQTRRLLGEATAVETAARIVSLLEDREDTNAGRGASLRMDGETIECAASVQDDAGRAGRVGGLRATWNPSSTALALYRAGGASVWGPAGDELSERLGFRVGPLKTASSERSYEFDLAQAVQSKTTNEFLLPLYVGGDVLAKALKTDPEAFATRPLRDPVFALVITPEGRSALAWSTGGAPFSPPGEPTPLLREETAPALQGRRSVILLSGETTCTTSPRSLVESLQGAFSLQFPVATLENNCPSTRYFIHGEAETRTNLRAESMLVLDGTMEQKAAREAEKAPADAPQEGPSESTSKRDPLPAKGPTDEKPQPTPTPVRASPPPGPATPSPAPTKKSPAPAAPPPPPQAPSTPTETKPSP